MRRKCYLTLHLIVSINSSREVLKASNKSVGESASEMKKDNHFSSQRWGEKRGG